MTIILRFSVSETNPSGTLRSPPTQAHFNSRLSMYTALKTETAPTVPMNKATGADSQVSAPATMRIPAKASPKG